jgi:hypothetical protein
VKRKKRKQINLDDIGDEADGDEVCATFFIRCSSYIKFDVKAKEDNDEDDDEDEDEELDEYEDQEDDDYNENYFETGSQDDVEDVGGDDAGGGGGTQFFSLRSALTRSL